MPDNIVKARFLSQSEKKMAIERLKENQTGMENKHFKVTALYLRTHDHANLTAALSSLGSADGPKDVAAYVLQYDNLYSQWWHIELWYTNCQRYDKHRLAVRTS